MCLSLSLTKRYAGLALLTVTLTVATIALEPVQAEESGASIPLSYVQGFSNWGPTNVYGRARIWTHEGEVALSVHVLPHLPGRGYYAAWVFSRRSSQVLHVGRFNTSEAGDATIDTIFAVNLPPALDTVLITVYPNGESDALPGPIRSAVGFITPATPTARPTAADNPLIPTPTPTPLTTTVGQPGRSGEGQKNAGSRTPPRKPLLLPHTGGGPCSKGHHRVRPCTPPTPLSGGERA